MTERHGERRDHPVEEPAPALTAKARSDEWVYDQRPSEKVKDRGSFDGVRGGHLPAPTLQAAGLAKGRDIWRMRANAQENAATREVTEPAPTITGGHDTGDRVWEGVGLRAGTNENDTTRPADEPAPTLRFGERMNDVSWVEERPSPTIVGTRRSDEGMLVGRQLPEGEGRNVGGKNWKDDPLGLKDSDWPEKRPATVVAGDPRIFQPGNHREEVPGEQSQNAGVSEQEAAILQGFPAYHPWQGSRSARFQQIGNAVPPPVAEAIARALLEGKSS